MLSKEEIEEMFEDMEYFIDDDYGGNYKSVVGNQDANSMLGYLKIRDYILKIQDKVKKLETREQKLIEKLEEDIANYDKGLDTNILLIKEYYKNRREYAQEILKILKKENDE